MPTADATTRTVRIDRGDDSIVVVAPDYRLEVVQPSTATFRAPTARLTDARGRRWAKFSLLASVHTVEAADETWQVESIDVAPVLGDDDAVDVVVRATSTAWDRRELRMRCTPRCIETSVAVEGAGRIREVTLFGGQAMLPNSSSGTFRSRFRFRSVFVPAATEPVRFVRPAETPAQLGVVGDADAGRLNAVFSPPPLVFAFGRKEAKGATEAPGGDWLACWFRASVEQSTMTGIRYSPLEGGFLLALDYEGHTIVDGTWTSPTVVLRPAASGWAAIEQYRADLVEHGFAPDGPPGPVADWWREPLFCGWGAQCARAAHAIHGTASPTSDTAPESSEEEPLVVKAAAGYARADVYDEFLARLDAAELDPGTIVIDDRWQRAYGSGEVDTDAWPDLRAWIAARHAEGRKVLLWWKAWDAEGIPAEECVLDPAGRPFTVDAGSEAYLARLAGTIRHLVAPDGLDADGFKIDFTQRGPSGEHLLGTPNVWGIAALHRLLGTIHSAAKAAKPDALVIAHAMHPSFGDVCDMVRLNDVSKRDVRRRRVPVVDQLAARHAIASRAFPGHLIDTDQWPMPNRREWLAYVEAQPRYGVPALYYLEAMDRSGEHIGPEDLDRVRDSWARYRESIAS